MGGRPTHGGCFGMIDEASSKLRRSKSSFHWCAALRGADLVVPDKVRKLQLHTCRAEVVRSVVSSLR